MTVSTDTSRVAYTGNGVTTVFSVPFPFIQNNYLRVLRTDLTSLSDTLLILDSAGTNGYTVIGAGSASGQITVVSPPTSNERITIIREVPATQEADFVANDPFPAETFESVLDKLTMICGQALTAIARVLQLSPADTNEPGDPGRYTANGGRIVNLADAVNSTDAVTLQQVQAIASGSALNVNRVAVTAAIPPNSTGIYSIDFGFTPKCVQITATYDTTVILSKSTAYISDETGISSVESIYAGDNGFGSVSEIGGPNVVAWAIYDATGTGVASAIVSSFTDVGINVNIIEAAPQVKIMCMGFR